MSKSLLVFGLAVGLSASTALAGPSANSCIGDVDGNGTTEVLDLLQVLAEWGCTDCDSDIDGSGIVDVDDLLIVLTDWGCVEPQDPTTTLSGTITNAWTGDPIEGAVITVGDEELTTNGAGEYSGEFAVGQYLVTFEAMNFFAQEQEIILFPDVNSFIDKALEPVAPVVVTVQVDGEPEPDGSVSAMAIVDVLDGSTIQSYDWMQISGAPAGIVGGNTDTATVNLGSTGDYKEFLFEVLAEPPIGADELPPGVPPPPGEFPGGVQNRFEVAGLYPFALEEAGLVGLEVMVTTTSGTYAGTGDVHTHIPWEWQHKINNVAIGLPVLMNGKEQASYDWVLDAPDDSDAVLIDADGQHPEFTPDVPGLYELMVTDIDAGALVTIQIYAGTWRGSIVGQDADGRPVSEQVCVSCHVSLDIDKFTPWAQTGHAEIFTDLLNNTPYYQPYCLPCHTVGFNDGADNNGFDDQPNYQAFLDAGLIGNPDPDNWTTMLEDFPNLAQRANVQCENCHGPQDGEPGIFSLAHAMPAARTTISSDMCAPCHGEPLRHGRFQQWQLSGHADYELAIDESQSGTCSKCHTGNGFLAWMELDLPFNPDEGVEVTWTEDQSHPVTCVTCHDPHAIGTMSGDDSNATVRISGHTPPLSAGFTAYGVGRGAICATCHNSRRGLRNESTWPDIVMTPEAARASHGGSQTDVMMGHNAYLVTVGIRGNHSFLEDTCVKCHMQETPPPEMLSYNFGGSNHTFYAGPDICADCHGEGFELEPIQQGVEETLHILQDEIEDAMLALIGEQLALGNTLDLNGEVMITDVNDIDEIIFGEFRGRQAITVDLDGTVIGPYRLTDVDVLDENMEVLGILYDFADPGLPKAGWNWTLIHNDESLGIHNPTYAFTVLDASIAALDPLAEAPLDWRALLDEWKSSAKTVRK